MACKHDHTVVVSTRGFSGAVGRYGNPAAHGNICDSEECAACGARRDINRNGAHEEVGAFGPSREERRTRARELRAAAGHAVRAVGPLTSHGITLTLDAAGCIVALATDSEIECAVASSPSWLRAAQRARRAVLAAEQAEGAG